MVAAGVNGKAVRGGVLQGAVRGSCGAAGQQLPGTMPSAAASLPRPDPLPCAV